MRPSAFHDAVHRILIADLRCPNCGEMSKPGAEMIHLDQTSTLAECSVCGFAGPIEQFQYKEQ